MAKTEAEEACRAFGLVARAAPPLDALDFDAPPLCAEKQASPREQGCALVVEPGIEKERGAPMKGSWG